MRYFGILFDDATDQELARCEIGHASEEEAYEDACELARKEGYHSRYAKVFDSEFDAVLFDF